MKKIRSLLLLEARIVYQMKIVPSRKYRKYNLSYLYHIHVDIYSIYMLTKYQKCSSMS